MTARALGLGIAATLSVGAAALAGGETPPEVHRRPPMVPAAPSPAATPPKTDPSAPSYVARAYALAARTWSAETVERAYRRELELAAGGYHAALLRARPTRAQIAALRADVASSRATVARVDARVSGSEARVVVELEERTRSRGRVVAGLTRNEVRLHRTGNRWRVVGFSALPGEAP